MEVDLDPPATYSRSMLCLVRGVGDIGSAVAHVLFREGYAVVLHDQPKPTTTRRGMAFADAVFDGHAVLEGVRGVVAADLDRVKHLVTARETIPVYVRDLGPLLKVLQPTVLVDARMRKHAGAEVQRGLADLTIGLGPDLVAGRHADVVTETSWDGLGTVIADGSSRPLAGEPRDICGHARDRYVYAPLDGVFVTKARIGDEVRRDQAIAQIDSMVLTAPLDGLLRGLTHTGVPVTTQTKIIEVDPRRAAAEIYGIGERPRRIAEGVLSAVRASASRSTTTGPFR
jgi:xanthine dehydrogenase accessory factor